MKCAQVEKRLPLYAGGDLPEDEAAQVAKHLQACPACRRVANGYDAAVQALREAGRQEPPSGDWRECWRAIEGHLDDERPPRNVISLASSVGTRRILKAAAIFLLTLGIGVVVGLSLRPAPAQPKVAEVQPRKTPQQDEKQAEKTDSLAKKPEVLAKREGEKLLTIEDLLGPGVTVGEAQPRRRFQPVAPVVVTGSRRGYYMDNVELVGNR